MRLPKPVFVLLALLPILFSERAVLAADDERDEILEHANQPWQGDLDGMTERGFLRILTVHNPLFFSFDGAKQKGMVAEIGKLFDDHLAEEIGRVRSPTIVLIPVGRDELIPGLIEGRGDVIMGNLTITPARQKLVAFGPPVHPNVDELVITGPAAKSVATLDDLVKIGLYVRRFQPYFFTVGLLFHLGIAVTLQIWQFLAMPAAYVLFLDPEQFAKWYARQIAKLPKPWQALLA